jgi:hypothetical protein
MVRWFKTLWSDIKGNAKWDALKWAVVLIREWWVPVVTTGVAAYLWFTRLSVPTRVLILTPVLGWFIQGIATALRRAKERSRINVEITMDDGYSYQQCLTIINRGDDDKFIAECEIESSNRPPNHPKGRFRLGWGMEPSPLR